MKAVVISMSTKATGMKWMMNTKVLTMMIMIRTGMMTMITTKTSIGHIRQ